MAQNSLQEMIDKIRASQKVNQMTPEQNVLWQQLYERTQPIAWQGAISWLSSSQKRKLRWSNAKDAAKWALSSIYGAAAFIPETLARIGTAWVDQIAGTDTQSKLDDIASYVPNKLRNSSSNTKAFDKWQEYTNDALMATALLTAWSTWPKSPTAVKRSVAQKNLNQLMKNPSAYSSEEAANIIRARYSLPNTATENALQSIWKWLDNVAQRIWNTKLFKAIDKAQAKKAARELWVTDFNTSKVRPWTDILKWNDYPAFAQKRYSDWMESINWRPAKSEPEWLYYMWTKKSAPDTWLELTQENVKNNNILKQAWYSDEEIFSLTPSERAKIVNNIEAEYLETWPRADAIERWLYEFQDAEKAAANTSRARANKLKSKNRSAAERTLLKKTERDAAKARADAENKSLEEMYNDWKRYEDDMREAAEDAYYWKLRDEWRR